MMKKNLLYFAFLGLIILFAAGAALYRGSGWLPAGYAAAEQAASVMEFTEDAPAAQQPEEERPIAPEGSVEILADGEFVCLAQSEEAATGALSDILKRYSAVPEGWQLVEVGFMKEVTLRYAEFGEEPLTREGVYTLLCETYPSLCPVRQVAELTEYRPLPHETKADTKTELLPKGSQLIRTLGKDGLARSVMEVVSVNGLEDSRREKENTTLFQPVARQAEVGRYQSEKPDKEPGRKEGKEGPEVEIQLAAPIKADISSNFGTRLGSMHYGIDYQAKAGTEVKAPQKGTVVFSGPRGSYGYVIDIDHGQGLVSRIARIVPEPLMVGDIVEQGQVLGTVAPIAEGEEGTPHLHFEVLVEGIPYNPRQYLD